jgi:hypothetical protein
MRNRDEAADDFRIFTRRGEPLATIGKGPRAIREEVLAADLNEPSSHLIGYRGGVRGALFARSGAVGRVIARWRRFCP